MEKPKRIQRTRVKGFQMPDNTVYVGRPTRYGNPFWHAQKFHGDEKALALFAQTAFGIWNPALVEGIPTADEIYAEHLTWLKRLGGHPIEVIRAELKGKNLACWCKIGTPCHADILLEIANG